MQFAPVSCCFLPLSHKCLPESPVFRTPSACFRSLMLEAKFYTHKEQRGNLLSVCFNIYILRQQRGTQKIPDKMVANIP